MDAFKRNGQHLQSSGNSGNTRNIRADNLDSTHGALHHGCYLCVWERVAAYSSRHATDIRRAMTDSGNIPPAMRTIAVLRTHDREVRMGTVNVAVRMEGQARDDAAKLSRGSASAPPRRSACFSSFRVRKNDTGTIFQHERFLVMAGKGDSTTLSQRTKIKSNDR